MLPSLKNAAVLSLIVAFAIATSSIAGAAEKKQSYVKSLRNSFQKHFGTRRGP
jgi:hypothetical protein